MAVRFLFLSLLASFSNFGWAQNIVLTVKPSSVEAKRGTDKPVELDCQGNTRDLSVFITKPINWKHVSNNGTTIRITNGFYLDQANQTRYSLTHGDAENSDTNYSFQLRILEVLDEDDGKYVCENVNSLGSVLSSLEVPFTVLNSVEKIKLSFGPDSVQSTSKLTPESDFEEGRYNVTCIAEGSNPEPSMVLSFNNISNYVMATTEKSFVGNRPSFKGQLKTNVYLSENMGKDLTIECSAAIPNNQYPPKYAALKLRIITHDIECDNVSAVIDSVKTVLTCRLHSVRGLDCSKIKWDIGEGGFIVYPGNKTKDSSFGIVMSDCNIHSHGNGTTLTTTLTFEQVKDIHFKTIFYVEYIVVTTAHRHRLKLYKKGSKDCFKEHGTRCISREEYCRTVTSGNQICNNLLVLGTVAAYDGTSVAVLKKPLSVIVCSVLAFLVGTFNRGQ